jgi:hypothetical protein
VGFHDSKSILRCQQSTPARRDAEDNHILHVAMGLEKFHALAAERTEGCKLDPTHNLLHILLEVHHPRVHVDDQGVDETPGRSLDSRRWGPHFLVGSADADVEGEVDAVGVDRIAEMKAFERGVVELLQWVDYVVKFEDGTPSRTDRSRLGREPNRPDRRANLDSRDSPRLMRGKDVRLRIPRRLRMRENAQSRGPSKRGLS